MAGGDKASAKSKFKAERRSQRKGGVKSPVVSYKNVSAKRGSAPANFLAAMRRHAKG